MDNSHLAKGGVGTRTRTLNVRLMLTWIGCLGLCLAFYGAVGLLIMTK